MRSATRSLSTFAFAVFTCVVFADEPLGPPSKFTAESPNGSIVAVADPAVGSVSIRSARSDQELWSIPGWHRWVFVADDGLHAVIGYDGMNLIPVDFSDSLVLFTFWSEGRKVREVTLREFVPSRSILKRTVSHYYWGGIERIDHGELLVQRADEKVFRFRLTDGAQAK
jgi:hypothetical protein